MGHAFIRVREAAKHDRLRESVAAFILPAALLVASRSARAEPPAATTEAAPPAPAAAPPPPPSPADTSVPAVRLHVDSSSELQIYGRPAEGYDWEPLCSGPCDKPVPKGWEFQARGDGVATSPPFVLEGPGDTAAVNIEAGSQSAVILGIVAGVGGGAAFVVGLTLWADGVAVSQGGTSAFGITNGADAQSTGIVVTLLGAVAGGFGALVMANNLTTKVKAVPAPDAQPQAAVWLPETASRSPQRPRLPPAMMAPLFDLTF